MPAQSPSTMSLTVQSYAVLSSRTASSVTRENPTVRSGPRLPFQGVRGAVSGAAPTRVSGSRRPATTRETAPAVWPRSLGRATVLRNREAAA